METRLERSSFEMESGCQYLIKNNLNMAFEVFTEKVRRGFDGLCITREFPSKIRSRYRLDKTPVVWLSAMRTENQATVDSLLDLSLLISNFLKKAKHGVVLLDGFEYLITNHGFDAFIRFLQFIRSRFEHTEAILIAPLLEEALEMKQTKLIEREMKLLDAE